MCCHDQPFTWMQGSELRLAQQAFRPLNCLLPSPIILLSAYVQDNRIYATLCNRTISSPLLEALFLAQSTRWPSHYHCSGWQHTCLPPHGPKPAKPQLEKVRKYKNDMPWSLEGPTMMCPLLLFSSELHW